MRANIFISIFLLWFLASCGLQANTHNIAQQKSPIKVRVEKTNEEWKQILNDEQYRVLRENGTERAFSGAYWHTKTKGNYCCAACNLLLFKSETKFESGTGWPSFWDVATDSSVIVGTDKTLGMVRDELSCARCDGHLGHVFDDGPKPTGLRYCINSVSLLFVAE